MRERLNNDPKVQLAVLAIAAVALGLILMIQLGGGGGETAVDPNAATTTPTTASGTEATGTSSGTSGTATDTGTAGTATTTPPATATDTGTVAPSATTPSTTAPPATGATGEALLPTKGLPSDVLVAYAKNQPVVLLVVDPRSRDAARLKKYAFSLDGYKDAAVFVVPTKKVPKYSRIMEGVQVSQTPAIVAVTPRKLNSAAPTASVTYGIRSRKSFRQAIADAAYKGGPRQSYP